MSKARDKGRRLENLIALQLTSSGIPAERVPLSGSLGGKYKDDVVIGTIDNPIARIECKNRENLSMLLWDWKEGCDYLVIKRNHKSPLFVLSVDQFIELYKGKYND